MADDDERVAKRCSRCKKTKERRDFHRSARHADGRQHHCKDCALAYQRSYKHRRTELRHSADHVADILKEFDSRRKLLEIVLDDTLSAAKRVLEALLSIEEGLEKDGQVEED